MTGQRANLTRIEVGSTLYGTDSDLEVAAIDGDKIKVIVGRLDEEACTMYFDDDCERKTLLACELSNYFIN